MKKGLRHLVGFNPRFEEDRTIDLMKKGLRLTTDALNPSMCDRTIDLMKKGLRRDSSNNVAHGVTIERLT